jgi:TPR repeat protein
LGKGIPCNPDKAATLFAKAAVRGFIEARMRLGICFFDGVCLQRLERGLELLNEAADHGLGLAQLFLGDAYINAKNVTQNHNLCRRWLEKAAASGIQEASKILANLKKVS